MMLVVVASTSAVNVDVFLARTHRVTATVGLAVRIQSNVFFQKPFLFRVFE